MKFSELEERENDSDHLDRILREVREHLAEEEAPETSRNVVQAMFDIHYADWLGGHHIIPTCDYERSQANGL